MPAIYVEAERDFVTTWFLEMAFNRGIRNPFQKGTIYEHD